MSSIAQLAGPRTEKRQVRQLQPAADHQLHSQISVDRAETLSGGCTFSETCQPLPSPIQRVSLS
jgi:hypothetical protein